MCDKLIFEADVEGGVGVGGKCHSRLADDVFWSSIFIARRVFDLIRSHRQLECFETLQSRKRTCMLTICPSPLDPSTIAVTSTKVSLATKFRMHRSYLAPWPVCAERSNLRAHVMGRARRRKLRVYNIM